MYLHVQDCLALGVIFAATDSVAVLQVLKQDRSPLLYSLVFGEGVINDATAVALLRAVQVRLQMQQCFTCWMQNSQQLVPYPKSLSIVIELIPHARPLPYPF